MLLSFYMRVLAAIVFVTCTSCATLFQGTSEEIALASDPSGATATVDDGHSGATPYSIHVNRSQDVQIHFSKPGYQSQDLADISHVQWGYVVSDLFFTALIGLAVDGLDGAMFYHSQQLVSAHLEPISTVGTVSPSGANQPAPAATPAVLKDTNQRL